MPFNPQEQSTAGIEVNALTTCHIDAGQVRNWHSTICTLEDKPGLRELSRDIPRIVVEKLCYSTVELEKGHSATEAAAVAEEHFEEEEGGLAEKMSLGNCDRKVDLESTANKNDVNKQQV